tara:strand:- start:659 stop:925 length:267 start_codon:yes stop_codon:yes gene_type:complete
MFLLVFMASFFAVFLLGLNSKILRDDHILLGSIISWFITIAQYAMTWAVFEAGLSPIEYLVTAGAGGSVGITVSQYLYLWLGLGVKNK